MIIRARPEAQFCLANQKHIRRHPKVLSVFKTLAILKSRLKESTVKVTAYDVVGVDQKLLMTSEKSDSTLDVMIFPIGLRYVNLPEELLENALMRGLLSETEQTATGKQANLYSNQQADRQLDRYEEDVSRKLHLFVCCHGARDRRCGERGTPLAARLHQLVKHKGLLDKIAVCQSSHVGGHAYAGNLLVYGSSHPADGDWFGCLSSNDATQVLDGLLDMEVGSDGGVEGSSREAWRGRVGLSRTEQIDLWSAGGEVVDFQSDSEDDVDGSC